MAPSGEARADVRDGSLLWREVGTARHPGSVGTVDQMSCTRLSQNMVAIVFIFPKDAILEMEAGATCSSSYKHIYICKRAHKQKYICISYAYANTQITCKITCLSYACQIKSVHVYTPMHRKNVCVYGTACACRRKYTYTQIHI